MLLLLKMKWIYVLIKRIQWYRINTYILTLAEHAYYDRFELVKQRNDLDMD